MVLVITVSGGVIDLLNLAGFGSQSVDVVDVDDLEAFALVLAPDLPHPEMTSACFKGFNTCPPSRQF